MNRLMIVTIAALLALTQTETARADQTRVLAESSREIVHKGKPFRGAIGRARPARRAARAAGRAAVVAGKVAKPGRRAAWMARASARGIGKAAKGIGRAARFGKNFRPFKKAIIIP